jgi:hypothetical protein
VRQAKRACAARWPTPVNHPISRSGMDNAACWSDAR